MKRATPLSPTEQADLLNAEQRWVLARLRPLAARGVKGGLTCDEFSQLKELMGRIGSLQREIKRFNDAWSH